MEQSPAEVFENQISANPIEPGPVEVFEHQLLANPMEPSTVEVLQHELTTQPMEHGPNQDFEHQIPTSPMEPDPVEVFEHQLLRSPMEPGPVQVFEHQLLAKPMEPSTDEVLEHELTTQPMEHGPAQDFEHQILKNPMEPGTDEVVKQEETEFDVWKRNQFPDDPNFWKRLPILSMNPGPLDCSICQFPNSEPSFWSHLPIVPKRSGYWEDGIFWKSGASIPIDFHIQRAFDRNAVEEIYPCWCRVHLVCLNANINGDSERAGNCPCCTKKIQHTRRVFTWKEMTEEFQTEVTAPSPPPSPPQTPEDFWSDSQASYYPDSMAYLSSPRSESPQFPLSSDAPESPAPEQASDTPPSLQSPPLSPPDSTLAAATDSPQSPDPEASASTPPSAIPLTPQPPYVSTVATISTFPLETTFYMNIACNPELSPTGNFLRDHEYIAWRKPVDYAFMAKRHMERWRDEARAILFFELADVLQPTIDAMQIRIDCYEDAKAAGTEDPESSQACGPNYQMELRHVLIEGKLVVCKEPDCSCRYKCTYKACPCQPTSMPDLPRYPEHVYNEGPLDLSVNSGTDLENSGLGDSGNKRLTVLPVRSHHPSQLMNVGSHEDNDIQIVYEGQPTTSTIRFHPYPRPPCPQHPQRPISPSLLDNFYPA